MQQCGEVSGKAAKNGSDTSENEITANIMLLLVTQFQINTAVSCEPIVVGRIAAVTGNAFGVSVISKSMKFVFGEVGDQITILEQINIKLNRAFQREMEEKPPFQLLYSKRFASQQMNDTGFTGREARITVIGKDNRFVSDGLANIMRCIHSEKSFQIKHGKVWR